MTFRDPTGKLDTSATGGIGIGYPISVHIALLGLGVWGAVFLLTKYLHTYTRVSLTKLPDCERI